MWPAVGTGPEFVENLTSDSIRLGRRNSKTILTFAGHFAVCACLSANFAPASVLGCTRYSMCGAWACERQREQRQWLFVAVARVFGSARLAVPTVTLFFLFPHIHSVTSFLCGSTSPLHRDEEYKTIKLQIQFWRSGSLFIYLYIGHILEDKIMCTLDFYYLKLQGFSTFSLFLLWCFFKGSLPVKGFHTYPLAKRKIFQRYYCFFPQQDEFQYQDEHRNEYEK